MFYSAKNWKSYFTPSWRVGVIAPIFFSWIRHWCYIISGSIACYICRTSSLLTMFVRVTLRSRLEERSATACDSYSSTLWWRGKEEILWVSVVGYKYRSGLGRVVAKYRGGVGLFDWNWQMMPLPIKPIRTLHIFIVYYAKRQQRTIKYTKNSNYE